MKEHSWLTFIREYFSRWILVASLWTKACLKKLRKINPVGVSSKKIILIGMCDVGRIGIPFRLMGCCVCYFFEVLVCQLKLCGVRAQKRPHGKSQARKRFKKNNGSAEWSVCPHKWYVGEAEGYKWRMTKVCKPQAVLWNEPGRLCEPIPVGCVSVKFQVESERQSFSLFRCDKDEAR